MDNVYYNPEKFGLKMFGSLDEPGLCYEYNRLIVLQHVESGRLFWAADSGCSCPTPFEQETFESPDKTSMSEITHASIESFERKVAGFPDSQEERDKLVVSVRLALR